MSAPEPTASIRPRNSRIAAALNVAPGDIFLIACHVWDTIGAGAAGWQSALILREGNAPLDVGPQPDYTGIDLDAIADQLIARYSGSPRPAVTGPRRSPGPSQVIPRG
jgi:hypothetical protein